MPSWVLLHGRDQPAGQVDVIRKESFSAIDMPRHGIVTFDGGLRVVG